MKQLKANPLASFRTDKHLPQKIDKKQDDWRANAGFDLEQVIALCSSEKLRPWRRAWNTLSFFGGGPRPGEAANLR